MSNETFWENEARQSIDWFQPWNEILEWKAPHAKWFLGATLNASYNCLDRHLKTPVADKIALLWEGERGDQKSLTYRALYTEVNRFANILKKYGIGKGDRVALYMPLIPDAVVAMLACARIGAIHTVIFGGFSAEALRDRILDAKAKAVITADGGFRRGKKIPLKEWTDQAVADCPSIEHVFMVRHTGEKMTRQAHDVWVEEEQVELECAAEVMDAEDLLFILYTSGTTGKPKGIMHTTGGYMVGAASTTRRVFDVRSSDVYWCTADIGWITGHTYVVYGPLANGMTQVIYEGAPDWPNESRFWEIIERYKVTTFYTSPTAIRTFMKWGEGVLQKHDLRSLRLLGSVGEPISPDAWKWYHTYVGGGRCPIVDTWWQTETGSIMIAPIPEQTALKPGSATFPLEGIEAAILNDRAKKVSQGYLAITSPWPSMLRGIYGNPERFQAAYWNKWPGIYFTGDGAREDEEGYYWLLGRVDDVVNVSGHRLGTAEVESALTDYPGVVEAAAIAIAHPIKGQAIAGFVTLQQDMVPDDVLQEKIKQHVAKKIGAFAKPEKVLFIHNLPKTRSGKVMRRLLRDIAEGRVLGDTTTLSDATVLEEIQATYFED